MSDALPPDIDPISRNRLAPVVPAQLDDVGRRIYETAASDPQALVGVQTGPPGILMHDGALYALWRPLNQHLRYHAGLDPRLIEVAVLASAREMRSRFEWHAHEAHARDLGVSEAAIEAIRRRGPVDVLSGEEAALVLLAREAIGEHRVRPETYARALRLFGQKQLVDYTALIGTYAATAILLETFDQHLPAGAVSALKER